MGDVTVAEALGKICGRSAGDGARSDTRRNLDDGRCPHRDVRFSHPDVQEIDQPQYDTGDGPCVDVFRTGEPVIIQSTVEPGPYEAFRAVAATHGLTSVVSVPMRTGPRSSAALLNLYSPSRAAFTPATAERLQAFAGQAAWLLVNHQAYWDAAQPQREPATGDEIAGKIEQAKGIIMAATGCTADEAFAQFRAQSQTENIKLRDIAAQIVRQTRRGTGSGGSRPG